MSDGIVSDIIKIKKTLLWRRIGENWLLSATNFSFFFFQLLFIRFCIVFCQEKFSCKKKNQEEDEFFFVVIALKKLFF